jgi:hypothetical protein
MSAEELRTDLRTEAPDPVIHYDPLLEGLREKKSVIFIHFLTLSNQPATPQRAHVTRGQRHEVQIRRIPG